MPTEQEESEELGAREPPVIGKKAVRSTAETKDGGRQGGAGLGSRGGREFQEGRGSQCYLLPEAVKLLDESLEEAS